MRNTQTLYKGGSYRHLLTSILLSFKNEAWEIYIKASLFMVKYPTTASIILTLKESEVTLQWFSKGVFGYYKSIVHCCGPQWAGIPCCSCQLQGKFPVLFGSSTF